MAEVSLLPSIAADVAKLFPELEGRSIAVSEAQITKENIPTLPLVMVSLARQQNQGPLNDASKSILNISDNFVIEFWLPPSRVKKGDGSETPFWSFYDYTAIRDRLLAGIVTGGYLGPGGERINYVNMTQESDSFAVTITFTLRATYQWCAGAELKDACNVALRDPADGDGAIITPDTFKVKICTPKGVCTKDTMNDASCVCDNCAPILAAARKRELDSRPQ